MIIPKPKNEKTWKWIKRIFLILLFGFMGFLIYHFYLVGHADGWVECSDYSSEAIFNLSDLFNKTLNQEIPLAIQTVINTNLNNCMNWYCEDESLEGVCYNQEDKEMAFLVCVEILTHDANTEYDLAFDRSP